MTPWITPDAQLPDEKALVWIRTKGDMRPRYYRIDGRWYALVDLERWRMRESPYWRHDRSWYLKTEDIEAWRAWDEPADVIQETA